MKLVIISGTTSTGKTTLARKLAKDLDIPVCLRDTFKEQEFDLIGKSPSLKQLSAIDAKSQKELYRTIKDSVQRDEPLIIESNFTRYQGSKIKNIIRPDTVVVEVFCFANGFRVLKRYVGRYKNGERHKGHRDYLWYPIVAVEAFGLGKLRYRPLKISSNVLMVDTNDFAAVDYDTISQFVIKAK